MHKTIAGLALLALAACGQAPESQPAAGQSDAATQVAAAAPVGGAPASFAACKACHAVEPGQHGIGPSLHGVYGTKSGALAGYAFSAPMKAAALTWDDATLDAYLTAPAKLVPGTKMSYAGMSDPAMRAELIAYLKTLK